jgi:hypothetical protein
VCSKVYLAKAETRPENRKVKAWLGFALGLAIMAAALATKSPVVDDFPAFYTAAQHPGAVYAATNSGIGGHFLPWLRIPSYAWLLQPFGALPYGVARVLWLITIAAALALFALLWRGERRPVALALCWSFPVAFGFALGQDTGFVLLIAAAAVFLWQRNRFFLAGLCVAILAFKITFLFALAIPFLRSRRAVLGIVLGVTAQLGLSFVIEPGWVGHYLAVLRSGALDPEPLKMISIRSLASALPWPEIAYALGFAALMFWLWRIAMDAPIVEGVSSSLAIALIAAPHCYVYDGVLLIPLLAKFASFGNWPGRAALFGLSPLPFLAILLGATRATALLGGALLIFCTCVVLQHSVAVRRAEAAS